MRAQLPSPTYGWNLGNTLEAPSGEGTWGPAATKKLIDAVADAGFNTVRIPCAWDSHADKATLVIDPRWMARVREVVGWCRQRKLYVILNCHWDGGWFENNIKEELDPVLDRKLKAYWQQIATAFRDCDDQVLFAGANEPNADTAGKVSTLMRYYETFIRTVRATGGNNAKRWLLIQGPGTDIDKTDTLMNALPEDPTPGRLMVEVHFYTPYQFCLMANDADWGKMAYFWGKYYHQSRRAERNASTGEEACIEAQFEKMRVKFVERGIPVVIGEFQAMRRSVSKDLAGADFDLHLASRTYFHKTVVDTANRKELKPIYWDIPGQLFDWRTGAPLDRANLQALTGGTALPPPLLAAADGGTTSR